MSWSKPTDLTLGERDTADPLGFRAVANRVAADLVPIVTQTVSSVRGFSLLCLGLRPETHHPVDPDERFLRVERLYMAAAVRPNATKGVPVFSGVQVARQLVRGNQCYLNQPILSHQMSSGIWGSYSRAAGELGLIKQGTRPSNTQLSKSGQLLAQALWDLSLKGEVQPLGRARPKLEHGVRQWIGEEQLDGIASRLAPVSHKELNIVNRAFATSEGSERLHRLCLQQDRLTSFTLDPTHLTEEQKKAWAAAVALRELIERVEQPYRAWVVDGSSRSPIRKPRGKLWDTCAKWDIDGTLRRLRTQFAIDNSVQGLHKWHEQLITERGGSAWQIGVPDEDRSRALLPDFRFGALSQLFEEGVRIR